MSQNKLQKEVEAGFLLQQFDKNFLELVIKKEPTKNYI